MVHEVCTACVNDSSVLNGFSDKQAEPARAVGFSRTQCHLGGSHSHRDGKVNRQEQYREDRQGGQAQSDEEPEQARGALADLGPENSG